MGSKLTTAEVADRLGVSRRQVIRLIVTGQITGAKTGEGRTGGYEIDAASVDAYLEAMTVAASMPAASRPALTDVLGPLYTLDEVAAYLNRSPEALKDDARKGKFEHIRIGSDRRMSLPQIRQLIEQATVRPGERTLTIPNPDADPELAAWRERVIRRMNARAARGVAGHRA